MRPNKDSGEEIEGYNEARRRSFEGGQSAKLNNELGLVPCVANPQLLDNGESNPIYSWRNRATYRWECPREEYVQSLEPVRMAPLSKKWGIPPATMSRWCRLGKWGLERQAFWATVAEGVKKLNTESIAATRSMEMADRLQTWRGMRMQLFSSLATGVIREMSAKGHYLERPLNPGDYKDITAAMAKIDAEIDRAMGIAGWVSKQGEGDQEAFGITRITNIAFNLQGAPPQMNAFGMSNEAPEITEGETVEPPALPPAEEPNDTRS